MDKAFAAVRKIDRGSHGTGAEMGLRTLLGLAIRRIGGVLLVALAVVVMGPMGVLAFAAQTRQGRWVGGFAIATLVGTAMFARILFPIRGSKRQWVIAGCVCLVTGAICLIAAARLRKPATFPEAGPGLRAFWSGGRPATIGRTELVPEIDQIQIGAIVFTALPFVPRGRAGLVQRVSLELSREIEADPIARRLGSAGLGLRELIGLSFDDGHYYLYIPKFPAGERLGAVVFLHGNAGNYKVMPWAWREFAERERMAIVCPSFGFGFWNAGAEEALDRAFEDACARVPIESERVFLAGISDGGKGVTRASVAHPERYRGLIYVSPTMLLDELGSEAFRTGMKGKPIFIAQGGKDWNVRQSTVDPAVALLDLQGSAVTYEVYPDEDHFLFFARRRELFEKISAWIAASGS